MSTILKALRKLEAQPRSPQAETPRPTVWQRKPSLQPGSPRVYGPVGIAALLVVAAALTFGAWMWWRDALRMETPSPQKPMPRTASKAAPLPSHPPQKLPSSRPGERAAPDAAPPGPRPAEPMMRPVQNKPPAPLKTKIRSPRAPTAPAPSPASPAVAGKPPRPAPAAGADRPGLTIQAIAWSSDPASRIAVINGRVVHEGDALGNIRVAAIGQSHVSLSDGRGTWTVKFGQR